MIISLCGASGFIGQALTRKIKNKEWTVRNITRENLDLPDDIFVKKIIYGSDVVINMAGAPIMSKWTPAYKKEILASRIYTTRKISSAIQQSDVKPALFLSASATGIYASTGTNSESSFNYGTSFLADVCHQWEENAFTCNDRTRVVVLRLGVVLGPSGGMLPKLERMFKMGLGAKLGNGCQPFSFIHIGDLADAALFIIENPAITGIVNAVSPFPTTNADFTEKLGKVLGQPAWLRVPSSIIKLIYGERAQVLLEGQRAVPEKLENAGFRFKYPTLQNVLMQIYR